MLYGFYGQRHNMIGSLSVINDNVVGSKTEEWGLGAVQEIDAAAMSLWIQWDEMHAAVACGNVSAITFANGCAINDAFTGNATFLDGGFNNINVVKGGALINF